MPKINCVFLCFLTALLLCVPFQDARALVDEIPFTLEHFEDKTASLGIEDVLAKQDLISWLPTLGENPTFGYTKSRIWFRFRIPKTGFRYASSEPLVLEVPYVYFEKIALYAVHDGHPQLMGLAGMGVPLSQRPKDVLRAGYPIFRISGPGSRDAEYFISIEGKFPLALPTNLIEGLTFPFHQWSGMLTVGAFMGLLLLAAFFNGFLAISLRSRMYMNYSLFVMSMGMLFLAHEGLTVQLFWPEWPWWALREMHIYGGIALIFYAQFVREFVSSRTVAPRLDRVLIFLVAVSAIRSVWMLFADYQPVAMIGEIAVISCNFLVLVIGLFALRSGVRAARYFFASSLIFNLSYILFVLQESNLIWIGEYFRRAPHFGLAVEVTLLSLALADRIRYTNRELVEQRAAVVQAEKLSALGRMAGEIAHEINNPLAIIHGNAVLIQKLADADRKGTFDLWQVAETIEQTANRISKVVKGMRALARDSRQDPFQEIPISSVLQDTLVLCQERFRQKEIKLEFPEGRSGLKLRCRSSEIVQVLVNLLNNAVDAVENAKNPWLKVEVIERSDRVEFSITDSGPGVPKAIRPKIHEPFFTTKEAGKGLGLGLSISRTIVEGHGGQLWLDEASPNTRFIFSVLRTGKA